MVLSNKILRDHRILLILIILFGLILRLFFFSGIGTSDDLAYSKFAGNIEEGIDPDASRTLSTRLGIIYITALSYKLFGINDLSSVLFVLLTSLGNIILIYYFGKLLFNKKTGLIAALLMSFFPLDIVYATKLLTDIPSAFFMSLGVYLFLHSEIKKKLKYNIGYIFSGILIGIGYLIRESAILIGLFFIIYIAYKRRIKKEYFLVPLGVLIIIGIELLLFLILTDNPLYKIQSSQQHLAEVMIDHNYYGRLDFPSGLFHYPYLILTNNLIFYFFAFIGISIIYCIVYKKKETYTLMIWFLALLIYLSLGSASLTQYLPFLAKDRYLSIITIPGILLIAIFFTEKKYLIKKALMPISIILLLITSIYSVYIREDRNILEDLRLTSSYLGNLDKTIYLDERSIEVLYYISKYDDKRDIRPYPDDLSKIKDSYVIINKKIIKNLKEANIKKVFPLEVENTPENWELIKEIGKDDIDKVMIYYVP